MRYERSSGLWLFLARGVAPILTRGSLPGDPADEQSRYIEAAVNGVLIGCIYLPNGNPQPGPKFDYKLKWFKRLAAHGKALLAEGLPVVLAGDYNVASTPQDIYPTKSWDDDALMQPESRAAYAALLKQGWTDAIRTLHPDQPMYTYWDYMRNRWPRDAGLRLDHLLLSPSLAKRLEEGGVDRAVRGKSVASDHAPAWVVLNSNTRALIFDIPKLISYASTSWQDGCNLVAKAVRGHFKEPAAIADAALVHKHVVRAEIRPDQIFIELAVAKAANSKRKQTDHDVIEVPWRKTPSTRRREILVPETGRPQVARPIRSENRALLVASIAQGRRWLTEIITDPTAKPETIAVREGCSARQVNMTISLAFLAPDLVKAAIEWRLPHGHGVTRMRDLPVEWRRQRQLLGL